ncbi:transposase mutator type [Burkholderia ambifaria IOP40-10]|uniref:Transposase mutator type n=1 Tax=Burkholderia ambifaria IOP40-10 TaxID=396596 RepID=B1FHF9_9BURK|nr:transposase mutator type [Burkholderia ambifaria IOP40-10]
MLRQRALAQIFAFLAFAPDIQKIETAAHAIGSLHMQLRRITKARSHFPSDDSALELMRLALRNAVAKWAGSRLDWKSAMIQIALLYPVRFNLGI